jgi:hypothetical protein
MLLMAVVALLGAAGCSGGGAGSATTPTQTAVVATTSSVAATSAPTSGPGTTSPVVVTDSLSPNQVLRVAGRKPPIRLSKIIERTQPKGAKLVSAVYVQLPIQFTRTLLAHPRPRLAWIFTYSNVKLTYSGGSASAKPRKDLPSVGSSIEVVDATTGEVLRSAGFSTLQ